MYVLLVKMRVKPYYLRETNYFTVQEKLEDYSPREFLYNRVYKIFSHLIVIKLFVFLFTYTHTVLFFYNNSYGV